MTREELTLQFAKEDSKAGAINELYEALEARRNRLLAIGDNWPHDPEFEARLEGLNEVFDLIAPIWVDLNQRLGTARRNLVNYDEEEM
jgi:hypothetical protein